MALLIAIKSITNVYDSPDVAYYCGQTYPWFYSGAFDQAQPNSLEIFQCNMKPDTCSANHYYENSYSTNINGQSVSFYGQYGYIESPESSGISIYPYYAFTIADKSTIFGHDTQVEFENPSLPYCSVLKKISRNHAILAVAPSDSSLSTAATNLQSYLSLQCDGRYNQSVVYFQSEGKINSYVTNKDYDDANYGQGKVAFAIILNQADIATAQWDYAIRVNYTGIFDQDDPTVACLYGGTGCAFRYTIPTTKYYSNDLMKPQTSDYMFGYSYSGFLTLQQTMDQYIFSFYNGVETEIMASVGLMPTQDYQSDDFQYIIASTLGIFYMLSFLYPVSRLIRALVLEKECRIKEGMKMMGLTSTIYNLSWLITTVLQMTLISVLITLVSSTTVFEYSNKFYVFIYFEAFSLAVINMCFLMAAFFSRSKTASLLGPMIFFATFFPYYSVSDPQYDQSSKAAACLLAPTCFALGANVFADYEGGLVGIQSDNVSQETSNFTYSLCVGMLFFDAFLYGILAWYCDKVIPSEFGTSLPFYFPLLPSYWCGASSSNKYGGVLFGWIYELFGWGGYRKVSTGRELQQPGNELDSGLLYDVESVDPKKAKYFEPVSPDLKQQIQEEKCISIRKLRKVFKNPAGGDDRIAVAGLNLEMYQNQVTVMLGILARSNVVESPFTSFLLGHNGAGKTTTISMLVGMIPPTSGNAMMPGGLDISNDMTQVRRNLGVCPQHDILFPELTALQHLEVSSNIGNRSSELLIDSSL
jgi:ATP-binding cassette subfamily A (ABC1) protein 3